MKRGKHVDFPDPTAPPAACNISELDTELGNPPDEQVGVPQRKMRGTVTKASLPGETVYTQVLL